MRYLSRRALTMATLLMLLPAVSTDRRAGLLNAQAQTASREAGTSRAPSGSITGRVTSGVSGVAGIAVELVTSPSPYIAQRAPAVARGTTDEDGRYRLLNIPAGRYYIRPVAPTFVLANENRPRGQARAVVVEEGEAIEGVNFSVTRGAVITGRVTNAEGRPVISEMVRLEMLDEQGQKLPLYYSSYSDNFRTDDRGIYRIYGLPAGRYRVSVGSSINESDALSTLRQLRSYVLTYHPNTTEVAEAKIVELSAGTEATGVNITVGALAEGYKADGRIVDAESGRPLPGLRYSYGITDRESKYLSISGGGDRSNHNGEFHIENLAPGRYAVFLIHDDNSQWYGEPAVFQVVNADVGGLEIKVRRGASLSGVVVVEGTSDRSVMDRLQRLQIYVSVDRPGLQVPASAAPKVLPDGSFQHVGLPPGKARINIWPPNSDGLSLVRIERDGIAQNNSIELAAGEQVTGIRLVLAYGTGVVRGRVVTPSGVMPEGMQLNVTARRVDTEPTQRGIGSPQIEVDERGRFLIEGLAGGEYEIALRLAPRRTPGVVTTGPAPRPVRPITQRVSVTNGAQTEVTFTLNTDTGDSGGGI
jgi:hypothetical protein